MMWGRIIGIFENGISFFYSLPLLLKMIKQSWYACKRSDAVVWF